MNELLPLLQDFHRERLATLLRHQAGARLVAQYDVNNTYQYIINREDTQLSWIAGAIVELGGTPAESVEPPRRTAAGKGVDASRSVLEEDARDSQEFVDRWMPRVQAMPNARHAKMLKLVLGEVLEQKRFFDQALAGRTDLLGRRAGHLEPAHGEVLASRWIE